MKYVECSIVEVKGGSRFEVALPHPAETNGFYLDIAVLAMPTPATGRPVLRDMSDFDLQVFRKRGSDRSLSRGCLAPCASSDNSKKAGYLA